MQKAEETTVVSSKVEKGKGPSQDPDQWKGENRQNRPTFLPYLAAKKPGDDDCDENEPMIFTTRFIFWGLEGEGEEEEAHHLPGKRRRGKSPLSSMRYVLERQGKSGYVLAHVRRS